MPSQIKWLWLKSLEKYLQYVKNLSGLRPSLTNSSKPPGLGFFPFLWLSLYPLRSHRFVLSDTTERSSLDSFFFYQYSRLNEEKNVKESRKNNIAKDKNSSTLNILSPEKYGERFATRQINANPCLEDRVIIAQIHTPSNGVILCAAVIDGHGGWQVAEYVQRHLPHFIKESLDSAISKKPEKTVLSNQEIGQATYEAFVQLDNALLNKIKGSVELGLTKGVQIGACCACVLVTSDAIITANAGDCRVVMSKASGQSQWLTSLHNASEPSEQKELRRKHPDESNILFVNSL